MHLPVRLVLTETPSSAETSDEYGDGELDWSPVMDKGGVLPDWRNSERKLARLCH